MAKETYYFTHDYNARNDPKLLKVMSKLGVTGIGIYWCLVEMLYEQGGQLQMAEIDTYAFALRTDSDSIKRVLTEFELFTVSGEFIVSPSALRRLDIRTKISEKASENAKKRWNKDATAMPPHSDRNAIKERKGKEKKVNKKKKELQTQIPVSVQTDLQTIVDKWNKFAILNKLTVCQKLHDDRKFNLYERFKESEFDIDKILKEIKDSSFLLGKNKKSTFKVDLDWIIKDDINYTKILEGKYKGESAPEKKSIEETAFEILELRKGTLVSGYNNCIKNKCYSPEEEMASGIINRLPDEKGYDYIRLKHKIVDKIKEYLKPFNKQLIAV